jgi:hypothetical protein
MNLFTTKRQSGFMYIAVLSVITVLMILVYALDYQSRSSKAVSRMAESRLYTDIAVSEQVGKTLTSIDLQYRSDVEWLDADLPIEMDPEQHTHETKWDDVRQINDWEADKFPTIGSFPAQGETAKSLGKEIKSPGSEDDAVAYPGQTRGLLEPESNDVGFKAPSSRYRLSLAEAFPFAAYAPKGDVTIEGSGISWTIPTDPQLDEDHRTLDFYSGFPFRVGAKGEIEVEDIPYGEAYSVTKMPQIKGGGIAYRGYLPYHSEQNGYAAKLQERLVGASSSFGFGGGVALSLDGNSYDKTDVVFGTLSVENIIKALFGTEEFNNFLTYEASTRWWFFLIPGFKSRGPALDINLHAPLKPDFGSNKSGEIEDTYGDDQNIAMTEDLQEATDALAEIELKLGQALLSPKLSNDLSGTQPLSVTEANKEKSPDFGKFTEIINDRNSAESKLEEAEEERDKITGKDEDKAADKRHKEKAKKLEGEAAGLVKKHGFGSVDQIDDWMKRNRKGSYEIENDKGVKETKTFNDDYEDLLEDWEDAQKDFAEAKNDAQGLDDGSPAVDEYDPGPDRDRQKELIRSKNLSKDGWVDSAGGTNLWTMVAKIAVVLANLVKDVGTAFYNHVFVEVKIFGITIPLPNPVKLVTFFFCDGEYKDQDIQGAPYKFEKGGAFDLLDLLLTTLKRALVQEVTLVYLGKDGGIGPSVPTRIGHVSADMQKGNPEGELGNFSIHNSFTVPAGRTFKLRKKGSGNTEMKGMTVAADLWLQRGSTMVIDGDLTMVNPSGGGFSVNDFKTAHKPQGKIVMEPGATLVVNGNFTAAGDPVMGSILMTRRPGRVEPITSGIICNGAVVIPHGIRSGLNLVHLAELIDGDVGNVMQNFFDDVVHNVAKVLGPFHNRKPHFARQVATFTFYFPVIVPNPANSMLVKNLNVKLFRLLSPFFAGSLNMTLGENFVTCSDWWMFGEDRVPAVPKVVPGAVVATLKEAEVQAVGMFDSSKSALTKMADENFFAGKAKSIVEGELGSMFSKVEKLANNMDDFIEDVAEDTMTTYFTVENITVKVAEFLGKAALSALDPSGVALIAFEEIQKVIMPELEGGDNFVEVIMTEAKDELKNTYGFPTDPKDYLSGVVEEVIDPFKKMAEDLKNGASKRALRVAATLMVAETPGVLIYGDSITVEGLYAAGLFVAKNDIDMQCAYTIGSMVSVEGNISAREVLYVPEFTRAAIYQPPATLTTPAGDGALKLPGYWANAMGFSFDGSSDVGEALDYGSGPDNDKDWNGIWHEVPDPNFNTAFKVSGGWGR